MYNRVVAAPRFALAFALTMGVSVALAIARPSVAEQIVYEPFLIGDGPGEYSLGPLPGQPSQPGPVPFFLIVPWAGDDNWVVQEPSLSYVQPGEGGSVTAAVGSSGDLNGRAWRYLADPWDDFTVGTYYVSLLANFGTAPPRLRRGLPGNRVLGGYSR